MGLAKVNSGAPDWDALAPVWHCFELLGLNTSLLSRLASSVVPPVLYVGGGRGKLPAQLARSIDDHITVIDISEGMARRARDEFGIEYVLADVAALPFGDCSFASAVCATGVLEYMKGSEKVQALMELARVTCGVGPILVSAAVVPETSDGAANNAPTAVEDWWRGSRLARVPRPRYALAFDAVARELGGRRAAYELLLTAFPVDARPLVPAEFAREVAAAGLVETAADLNAAPGVAVWKLCRSSAGYASPRRRAADEAPRVEL